MTDDPLLGKPMGDLFQVSLDEYPEPMRAHIAKIRAFGEERDRVERKVAFRRRLISIIIESFYNVARLCLLVIAAWFVAQVSDRTPPLRNHVEIITKSVRPGDQLKMSVEPHRLRLCETKVTFYAFDGESAPKTVVLDWQYPIGPIGIDKPFMRPITIPADAAPGPSRLRIERQYRCPFNLVHRIWPITEISPDMSFTILPKAGP